MIEEMNFAGLSKSTQEEYIRSILQLVRKYRVSPDIISEEQVRQYLVDLYKKSARGTFMVKFHGIKFFYYHTLGFNWDLFTKKKSESPVKNVCRKL